MSKSVYKSEAYREETGPFGETEERVVYRVCYHVTDHTTFIVKRADGSFETIFSGSDDLVGAMCHCSTEVRGAEASEVLAHWNENMFPDAGVAGDPPGQCCKSSPLGETPDVAVPDAARPRSSGVTVGEELSAHVPNAVIGYFTRGPLKWLLVRVEDAMLTGIDVTSHGKVHTMHMGLTAVDDLVLTAPLQFGTPPVERPDAVEHLSRLTSRAMKREAYDLAEHLMAYGRHLNAGRDVVPEIANSGMQR